MKITKKEKFYLIEADDNKQIRDINDIYKEEYYDEEGNLISEHKPYYTKELYIPLNFNIEEINEYYIEEEV